VKKGPVSSTATRRVVPTCSTERKIEASGGAAMLDRVGDEFADE
jgi:hypothetical protein